MSSDWVLNKPAAWLMKQLLSPVDPICDFGSRAAPGVVVPRVEPQGCPVRLQAALEVLVGQVLVPCQRVGVREVGLHLRCAVEEAQRRLVLLRRSARRNRVQQAQRRCLHADANPSEV